jgi:uncharacterized phage-like protein YoqJ
VETGTIWSDDKTIEYYWAKPADYVTIPTMRFYEAKATFDHYDAWLTQTFGPSGSWILDNEKWMASQRKYYFREEKDRMLFLLRFTE